MEEIKLSPKELALAIKNGRILGSGYFGTVFTYQDKLIKLDKDLYCLLCNNYHHSDEKVIERFYKNNQNDFINRHQIEELVKKQSNVTLTKLPTGIVTLKDVDPKLMNISPGIIIPYHKNHQKLEMLKKNDYKKLLIILKKLLLAVRELADNEIAQEDLGQKNSHSKRRDCNILYKGDTPQIIDLAGKYVKVSDEFIDASLMYQSLGEVILDYFTLYKLESPYKAYDIEKDSQIVELLNEFEHQMKGKEK